jgi:carboxymethylenebutenolidase
VEEVKAQYVDLKVGDETTMRAYVARPEREGNYPGLLVFQEAFGVNGHIRDITERYARCGYCAIAPELFHRTGPGFEGQYDNFDPVREHMMAVTDDNLVLDIKAAQGWLDREIGEETPKASIGFCMGGRVSFLAALTLKLNAAVSYYGGGIAKNERSAGLTQRASEIKAPILFNWGGLDQHIGPEAIGIITQALDEAGKKYVNVVYSFADHGFNCDVRASYNAEASEEAQAHTLAFLKLHTGNGS